MGAVYVLRPDKFSGVEVGHTIAVTKVIQVTGMFGNVVRGDDGNTYSLGMGWDYKFVTPKSWPPSPGDVWKCKGVRYAAILRGGEIVLEPMDSEMAHTVYQDYYERFLLDNPILESGR